MFYTTIITPKNQDSTYNTYKLGCARSDLQEGDLFRHATSTKGTTLDVLISVGGRAGVSLDGKEFVWGDCVSNLPVDLVSEMITDDGDGNGNELAVNLWNGTRRSVKWDSYQKKYIGV